MSTITPITISIANGQTTSSPAVDLQSFVPVALEMPATFTGTSVTFQNSPTLAGTFKTIYKDGADFSFTVAASKHVILQPADFASTRFLKVVSGSSEGGARTLILWGRIID